MLLGQSTYTERRRSDNCAMTWFFVSFIIQSMILNALLSNLSYPKITNVVDWSVGRSEVSQFINFRSTFFLSFDERTRTMTQQNQILIYFYFGQLFIGKTTRRTATTTTKKTNIFIYGNGTADIVSESD